MSDLAKTLLPLIAGLLAALSAVPAFSTQEFRLKTDADPRNDVKIYESCAVAVHAPDTSPSLMVRAGRDRTASVGETVILDASESMGRDGLPLTFAWRLLSGSEARLKNCAGAKCEFTPETPGTYIFSVVGTDGVSRRDDTIRIDVSGAVEIGSAEKAIELASVHPPLWFLPNGGSLILAGSGAQITYLDISSPERPFLSGCTTLPAEHTPGNVTGADFTGATLYVASSDEAKRKTALLIIDLTDTTKPVITGKYEIDEAVRGIVADSQYVFMRIVDSGAGADERIDVVDVSAPAAPRRAGYYAARGLRADRFFPAGDVMYVFALPPTYDKAFYQAVDISNPARPALIKSYEFYPDGLALLPLAVAGGRIFNNALALSEPVPPEIKLLHVIDAADPNALRLRGSVTTATGLVNHAAVDGDYAFFIVEQVSGKPGENKLLIIDATDPDNPRAVAAHDIEGEVTALFAGGGRVYVSTKKSLIIREY